MSSKDRQKKRILEMTEALNIKESVANTAVFIYETAVSLPGWKNRKHDYQTGILVACIYHACDAHRCHRTPAELCVVLGIDPKNARRMVKYTEPAAEIANAGHHGSMSLAMQVLPRCIYRMGSIPSSKVAEVKKLSMRIYDRVRNEIDNHRPDTITAGIISAVAVRTGILVPHEEVASACMVAANTVKIVSARISSTYDLKS